MKRLAFRMFGDLYFSGHDGASTHIVDTGDGLLLFDTGYPSDVSALVADMEALSLNIQDLRWIMHTHGHIDHMGGTKALTRLSGAKTYIGAPDADAAAGRRPLSFAEELGMTYDTAFEPDVLLSDGDRLTFGNTEVLCVATPGHTEGALSYFFNIADKERGITLRVGLHGGMGVNSMAGWYLDKHHLPYSLRDDFLAAMDRLNQEHVDIFLANHMAYNQTAQKYLKLLDGDKDAFVGSGEWKANNIWYKSNLVKMISDEAQSK